MKAALERAAVETKTNECLKKNIYARLIQITFQVRELWKQQDQKKNCLGRWIKLILSITFPQAQPQGLGWPAKEEPSPTEGQAEQPHGPTKLL